MEVDVNYWAIVLAAVSSMIVGSLWYMPATFGNMWMKLAKVKVNNKMTATQSAVMYVSAFVFSLVTAYVLAHVTFLSHYFFSNSYLQDALTTGFWLWLGFTAVRFGIHDLFEARPRRLTILNAMHELVTVMIMALIIGLMGM
jgi:hypothetical protein